MNKSTDLYSDELVFLKRQAIMDLIGAILDTPRKEQSSELWKVLIDGTLDRLDREVYEPLIQSEKVKLLEELMEQQKGKAVGVPVVPIEVLENKLKEVKG